MNCPKCHKRSPEVGDKLCMAHRLTKPVSRALAIAPEQFDDVLHDAQHSFESVVPLHGPFDHSLYLDKLWWKSQRFIAIARAKFHKSLIDDDARRAEIAELFAEHDATSHRLGVTQISPTIARKFNGSERYSMMLNGGTRRIPKRPTDDESQFFAESDHDFASLVE